MITNNEINNFKKFKIQNNKFISSKILNPYFLISNNLKEQIYQDDNFTILNYGSIVDSYIETVFENLDNYLEKNKIDFTDITDKLDILELYIQLGQIIEIFFSFNKNLINEVVKTISYFSDFISIILFLLKQQYSFKNLNKRLFYLRLNNFKRVQSNKSIDEQYSILSNEKYKSLFIQITNYLKKNILNDKSFTKHIQKFYKLSKNFNKKDYLLISSNLDNINQIMINFFIEREIDEYSELHLSLPEYKFIYVVTEPKSSNEIIHLTNINLDYLYDDKFINELKNKNNCYLILSNTKTIDDINNDLSSEILKLIIKTDNNLIQKLFIPVFKNENKKEFIDSIKLQVEDAKDNFNSYDDYFTGYAYSLI